VLRRVAVVRIDVSEERSTFIIRVIRVGELGTTLAVISNQRKLRRYAVTLMIGALRSSEMLVLAHGDTYQKMVFFVVTAVNT
jgi:hypothetical protein